MDKEFLECFSKIRKFSLVDKYRCFELWNLVQQTAGLKGALIEVGVWRGGTGGLIARKAELMHIDSPIFLCDTFEGVVKAGAEDPDYSGGEHSDTSRELVEKLIDETLNLTNVHIVPGTFPDETGAKLENERFRFCHIDVDVYQSAKEILNWVWPRLIPGGIIVYDDYGFATCDGITRHVEEEIEHRDVIFIHNLNGHAILIKMK